MDKFRNKYRIQSHRMPGWDYSSDGFYFITLVTQNRECLLGYVAQEKMILSEIGRIVHTAWLKSFEMRRELLLDEYIIMPNHLHAIVIIDHTAIPSHTDKTNTVGNGDMIGNDGIVKTHGRASLRSRSQSQSPQQSRSPQQSPQPPSPPNDQRSLQSSSLSQSSGISSFIRKPKSISSFIAGFKSAVNTNVDDYIDTYYPGMPKYNKNNPFFHPNYHDHIIRNHQEYQRITNYIINNPVKWDEDKFYTP